MYVLQKIETARYGPQKGKPVKLFMYKQNGYIDGPIPMLAATTLPQDAQRFETKRQANAAKKTSSYWKDYEVVKIKG